jgi:hypothetical protein
MWFGPPEHNTLRTWENELYCSSLALPEPFIFLTFESVGCPILL